MFTTFFFFFGFWVWVDCWEAAGSLFFARTKVHTISPLEDAKGAIKMLRS